MTAKQRQQARLDRAQEKVDQSKKLLEAKQLLVLAAQKQLERAELGVEMQRRVIIRRERKFKDLKKKIEFVNELNEPIDIEKIRREAEEEEKRAYEAQKQKKIEEIQRLARIELLKEQAATPRAPTPANCLKVRSSPDERRKKKKDVSKPSPIKKFMINPQCASQRY